MTERSLDEITSDIARSDQKRIRIMAGPGTGKSRALKRRVSYLLKGNQDPKRILAVTFTRNAATELVNDLTGLDISGCEDIHARTLHSYCFSLSRSEGVFEDTNRTPRLIMTFYKSRSLKFEGKPIIDDLLTIEPRFESKRKCVKRLKKFEAAWAGLQSEEPGWPVEPIDKIFDKHLREWLQFHNAMLIGEFVPEVLRFLRNNQTSNVLTAFDHIIVDEYQDLNRAEQEIINFISKKSYLMIVGDANQSIYGFRYAHPDGIINFKDPRYTTYDESFMYCQRCPPSVVKIANNLISHNHTHEIVPKLRPIQNKKNDEVHIIKWRTLEEEAKEIGEYVNHLLNKREYTEDDILIITPHKEMAYRIRNIISEKNISVHSYYDDEILENTSVQSVLTILALLDNREDRVALRWWLGQNNMSSRSKSYQKLREYCESRNRSPKAVLEDVINGKLELSYRSDLPERFKNLTEKLDALDKLDMPELIDNLMPKGEPDYTILRKIAKNALAQCTEIGELYKQIKEDVTQPKIPDFQHVKIMSAYKSKGLSSKVVIVTGCNQGLFPHTEDDLPPDEQYSMICEQRRLFYVAITRCKEILVMSSFRNLKKGDASKMIGIPPQSNRVFRIWVQTSQFIKELGSDAPTLLEGSKWKNSGYT